MILLLRHCQASGQEASAPLTELGQQQARSLISVLKPFKIKTIVSSPYLRAIDSIRPFANSEQLNIRTDLRLSERVLGQIPPNMDWRLALKQTFDDPHLSFQGGESTTTARCRLESGFSEYINICPAPLLFVTHGNALTLLLNSLDSSVGFSFWQELKTPDLVIIEKYSTNYRWQKNNFQPS